MSSPFDPGPWSIVPYDDNRHPSLVIHCAPDERVCFMATPGSAPDAAQRIRANAKLIVVAPELLQLAEDGLRAMEEDLLGILESVCLLDHNLQPRRETAEEQFVPEIEAKEARIAAGKLLIAKARGEA